MLKQINEGGEELAIPWYVKIFEQTHLEQQEKTPKNEKRLNKASDTYLCTKASYIH